MGRGLRCQVLAEWIPGRRVRQRGLQLLAGSPDRLCRRRSGFASELLRLFTKLCCRIYSSNTRKVRVAGAVEASVAGSLGA